MNTDPRRDAIVSLETVVGGDVNFYFGVASREKTERGICEVVVEFMNQNYKGCCRKRRVSVTDGVKIRRRVVLRSNNSGRGVMRKFLIKIPLKVWNTRERTEEGQSKSQRTPGTGIGEM